jgi:hypothetical protein
MTIVANLETLRAELMAFPGPKPNLVQWLTWIEDAKEHIGPEHDAPSSAEKAAMEEHKAIMAARREQYQALLEKDKVAAADLLKQYPELEDSDGEEVKSAQSDARIQDGQPAERKQDGSEGQKPQASGSNSPVGSPAVAPVNPTPPAPSTPAPSPLPQPAP